MNLPGKLVLGFVQEDNPIKGYFRVRPMLVEEEAEFLPVEDAGLNYLEDGYIRIVPDKNELSHFKSRMRSLGCYCLIDLRKHIGENDKIRPNKNYPRDDRNAYIVYSDVVQRVPDSYMAEICEGLTFARPGTRYVMMKNGESLDGPYEWEDVGDGSARLADHVPADPDVAQPEKTRQVKCGTSVGEKTLLLRLNALGVREPMPEPRRFAQPIRPELRTEPQPAPEAPKAEPAKAAEPAPAPAEAAPAEPVKAAEPVSAAEPAPEAPKAEPAPADDTPPPWIHHITFPPMRAISAKLSPREQSLLMQSGINPKRGASMRDVVDEQWRQSRLDQLGHPVPAQSTAQPVLSPVEDAVRAFKQAWDEPNARPGLVRELLRNQELAAALDLIKAQPETEDMRVATASLTELEAERLKMLSELDRLRRDRNSLREQTLEELKRSHAQDLALLEKQKTALESQLSAASANAEAARKAAEAADEACAKWFSPEADQKLCDMLAQSRAAGLLQEAVFGRMAAPVSPEAAAATPGEMITDLRVYFEKAGVTLDNDDAVHLLVCLALGRILMISGPSGAEHSKYARLLAGALGLPGCGRFAEMRAHAKMDSVAVELSERAPGDLPVIKRPDVKQVLDVSDGLTLSMLLLDEANQTDPAQLLGEMMTLGEMGASDMLHGGVVQKLHPQLRVAMTVSDMPDGKVLSPDLLDRVWFTRLCPLTEDAPWAPPAAQLPECSKPLALASLLETFAPKAEPSDVLVLRMNELRRKLARIGVRLSRQALDDTWRYCAAAQPYMRCDERELLDRALSTRAMPWILASAQMTALHELPELLAEYPRCLHLMNQPLPFPAL